MKKLASTQRYLPISEIKNDTVVLKDGSLRAVLLVSSVNFALKSEEEQQAIIQGYVNFLNTLDFQLQVVVQSRLFNIDAYLENLEQRQKEQTNELLRVQIADYIEYIRELIHLGEIMNKKFFIVVPYNPLGDKKRRFFSRLMDLFSGAMIVRLKRERFEQYREALFRRVDRIISILGSLQLKAVPLDTQSLIEIFYQIYNPIESVNQKIVEKEKLRVEE